MRWKCSGFGWVWDGVIVEGFGALQSVGSIMEGTTVTYSDSYCAKRERKDRRIEKRE